MIALRRFSRPVYRNLRRNFSDAAKEDVDTGALLEGSTEMTLGKVIRHGKGDAVIVLNVGGKDFLTLRSTVNGNPVLADHVARAEQNREKTSSGAVFIDRESTHFQFILNYLRNRVERMDDLVASDKSQKVIQVMDPKSWAKFTKSNIQLPKNCDDQTLRELYLEATYYRIPELQSALTEKNFMAKVLSIFNGSNPFDSANQMMARLRTFLITFTTLSATGITVAIQRDFDAFLKFIGWRDKNAPVPEAPPSAPAPA